MIYACLRFIEEWAHPLTFVNFLLIGLVVGLRPRRRALARSAGEAAFGAGVGAAALVAHARRLG